MSEIYRISMAAHTVLTKQLELVTDKYNIDNSKTNLLNQKGSIIN